MAIQEPAAFYHDVCDVASRSTTRDEFYEGLSDRQDERMRELSEACEHTASVITVVPSSLDCWCGRIKEEGDTLEHGSQDTRNSEQWERFLNLEKTMAIDALVAFVDGFIPEGEHKRRADRRALRDMILSGNNRLKHNDQPKHGNQLNHDHQPTHADPPKHY